jgi:hypothetical protein
LGSLFSSLFRSSWPLLKRAGLYLGKRALKTGLHIASDTLNNRPFNESAKDHFQTMGKEVVNSASNQLGHGRKRKAIKRKLKPVKRIKRRDIFD